MAFGRFLWFLIVLSGFLRVIVGLKWVLGGLNGFFWVVVGYSVVY